MQVACNLYISVAFHAVMSTMAKHEKGIGSLGILQHFRRNDSDLRAAINTWCLMNVATTFFPNLARFSHLPMYLITAGALGGLGLLLLKFGVWISAGHMIYKLYTTYIWMIVQLRGNSKQWKWLLEASPSPPKPLVVEPIMFESIHIDSCWFMLILNQYFRIIHYFFFFPWKEASRLVR